MERRQFCRFIAASAASSAIPGFAQTSAEVEPGSPKGFNQYTPDYSEFCALAPDKRVFYKVSDPKIVQTRLDESTWQPLAWNSSPAPLQVAGGVWDDVPLEPPMPNLAGELSRPRPLRC